MQEISQKAHTPLLLPLRLRPRTTHFTAALTRAYAALRCLDTLLRKTSYPEEIFSLFALQEAIASAKPCHTRVSREMLFYDAVANSAHPVFHYLHAFNTARARIAKEPFSQELFCSLHALIRHKETTEGYRTRQNWIGPAGCTRGEAYFLPPKPEKVASCMQNLIAYCNAEDQEPLLQLALICAQILIIHPFMDGNGRVARLLLPLFLFKKGLISLPYFFLSVYLQKHRLQYVQSLFHISDKKAWEPWICFFLKGIQEQGQQDYKKGVQLATLAEKTRKQLRFLPHKEAETFLRFLLRHPVFPTALWKEARLCPDILKTLCTLKIVQLKKGKDYCVFRPLFDL